MGTEELSHLEMIGAIVYQLTRNLTLEEIKKSGFDTYFVDHTTGIYPVAASGYPYTAAQMQSKGDVITDLHEDLAADATTAKEQPAIRRTRKPLILLVFRTLKVFAKMAYLQSHKNNLTRIYTIFYKIHDRTSCFREYQST